MGGGRREIGGGRREDGERAISPLVGSVLLLAIVVVMVGVVAVMLTDTADSFVQPAPVAATQGSVDVETAGGSVSNELTLLHTAGEDLPAETTYLVIDAEGDRQRVPVSETGVGDDGAWQAGERLAVELNESAVCTGDEDEIDVKVVIQSEDGSGRIVESKSVPVRRGQFDVRDGAVVPTTDYSARVELIGTAITLGAGGPPVPVYVEVEVGDSTTEPWPGDVNDGGNPRSWSVDDQSAGTEITVNATADAPWFTRTVSSQHENSDLVRVLRDGDEAPDTAGFANQAGAGSYVAPYVENDTIVLDDNQAIFLFELGASNPDSAAADFQDAVVLVSLDTEDVTVRDGDGETEVLCPGG